MFYCKCARAHTDELKIETSHSHTSIPWVKKYQGFLDHIIGEFVVARNDLYNSQDESVMLGNNTTTLQISNSVKDKMKGILLMRAFRNCYSLLDKIGISVLEVLEIDHKRVEYKHTNIEGEDNSSIKKEKASYAKIYFLNMWDFDLISNETFEQNRFLIALYSIAKDLGNDKYSALKSFRKLRNNMEHSILLIEDNNVSSGVISKEELNRKCMILMRLTRSAIFTYTNIVRRQSLIIDRRDKKELNY